MLLLNCAQVVPARKPIRFATSVIMTGKTSIPNSSIPPFETAPPSYDDSLRTPWQGTSTGHFSNLPFTPRPALDPAQHTLYSTEIPDNAEQPTYQERLVSGIEKTIIASGDVTRGDVVTHDLRLHDREL